MGFGNSWRTRSFWANKDFTLHKQVQVAGSLGNILLDLIFGLKYLDFHLFSPAGITISNFCLLAWCICFHVLIISLLFAGVTTVLSTTFRTSIMLCMHTSTVTTLPYGALPSKQQRYHMLLHSFLSLLTCQWFVSHNLSVFSKNPAKRSENMQKYLWSIRSVLPLTLFSNC